MRRLIVALLALSIGFSAQSQNISELYNKLAKSVVVIKVTSKEPVAGYGAYAMTAQGLGSGFIISEDGLIMTAAHVIQTAEDVKIKFLDGTEIGADIISASVSADVALVRLRRVPADLQVVKLGNSDEANVGDRVMVIGAPFGIEHSLSVGHISGRHKEKSITGSFLNTEFLQTDAAINKGNSGGPMFNEKGEVIGIVSFILSQSGGFNGIGFAATSNIAKELLMEKGSFWSGVEGYTLAGPLAQIFNVPQKAGFLVQKVARYSPGYVMGLKGGEYKMSIEGEEFLVGGDIILSVEGIVFDSQENLERIQNSLAALKSGDKFKVMVLRGGRTSEMTGVVP